MNNGSKRTLSRVLAFVMIVSSMFANLIVTNAKISDITSDNVISGSAVDTQYKWTSDDLAAEATANVSLPGEIFSYHSNGKNATIESNSKVFEDGSSMSQRFKSGGKSTFSKLERVFQIDAPAAGQLYVYMITGSNSATRNMTLLDSTGATVASDSSGPYDSSAMPEKLPVYVYDIEAAGTYYITFDAALNFYGMAFKAEGDDPVIEETTEETTVEETTAEETTEVATVEETTVEETTTAGGSDTPAGPEAGKTYTANFATLTVNDKLNGFKSDDGTIGVVSATDAAYVHDGSHGAALFNGDQITVAVAGDADVTLNLCQYGNGTEFAVTDAAGTALGTVAAKGATDGEAVTFSYKGEATTLTFTLAAAGEAYLHSVTSSNMLPPIGEAKNFEIWLDDIATVVGVDTESGAETKAIDAGRIGADVTADSTLTLIANGTTQFTNTEYKASMNQTYPNKEGSHDAYKAGARHATANDIPSIPTGGEGTAVVFTPAATGTFVVYFYSSSFLRAWDFNNDGTRNGYTDSDVSPMSYAIKAVAGHTYVFSTTGKTNNMAYAGFEYIVDEPTTIGTSLNNINVDPSSLSSLEVYLTDVNLGTVEATVKADTTAVSLAKNHTYKLTTNDGGVYATVAGSETFTAGESDVVIDLENIPDETLTGEITGTPEGTVTDLKFTNMVNGVVYTATITGNTYTCVMKPGDYNASVSATNGGVTYDRAKVVSGATNVDEVYVEVQDVTKGVKYDLPTEVAKSGSLLTLNNITANNSTSVKAVAGSTIVIPVTGKQVVTVAGWYAGTWDINGQNPVTADSSSNAASPVTTTYITDGTETSVTVNVSGEGSNYLYWIDVQNVVEFKSEISVPGDYDTLNDAVKAIKAMDRPEGEAGRVTINLTADIQEQVLVDAPYVKINGNNHTISWYYGVGTFYYSCDSNGYYSERLFRDKYSSNEASGSLWGGTVIVTGDYFLAENTTFKNTYNYEVTDKEIPDFAKTATSAFPQRTSKDVDVQTQAAKERSNALYVDGDHLECYNCNILSSQDTLGANKGTDYYAYFKDCVIGGNTDFICGAGNMVFDNCELQIKTVTQDGAGNNFKLIGPTPRDAQYVFRNCDITVDTKANGEARIKFGRTWQQNSYSAFINTETNGLIDADGWGEMSAGQLATAQFIEYNNYAKGIPMEVTPMGNIKDYSTMTKFTDEEVQAIVNNLMSDEYTIATVLGGWTPVHYGQVENEFTTESTEATTEYIGDPSGSVDITKGLVKGNNDDVLFGLVAGEDMPAGTEIFNDADVAYVAGTNNPSVDGTGIKGGDLTETTAPVPNGGAYIGYNAVKDGTLTVTAKLNDGKMFVIVDGDGNLVQPVYTNSTGASEYKTFEVPVTAGQSVYLYAQGSKARFSEIKFAMTDTSGSVDVTQGLVKGNNDNVLAGLEAGEDMPAGTEIFNDADVAYVAGTNNPSVNGTGIKGGDLTETTAPVPNGGAYIAYKAAQNGTFKTTAKLNDGKMFVIVDADGNLVQPVYTNSTGASEYKTFEVPMNAGQKIYLYAQGSKARFSEISFTSDAMNQEETTEATTEETTEATTNEETTEGTTTSPVVDPDTTEATTVESTEATTDAVEDCLWGDMDHNKAVEAKDAAMVIQYVLNPEATEICVAKADVSGNGIIDSEDAAMILQKALDGSYTFPVEPTTEETTEATTEETTEAPAAVKVFVVGDSTACHYVNTKDDPAYNAETNNLNDPNFWYKRVGFGDKIGNYLNENAEVVNLALSGRSSKSYATGINENGKTDQSAVDNYARLKSEIKAGDYLIIAWGHNDEKTDAYRYTDPNGDVNTEGSFKNSLYNNYIKVAQDAGATPILCTPIIRANESKLSSNDLHQPAAGDYVQPIRDLGAELGVTVIDNFANTQALYDELQQEAPANALGVRKAVKPAADVTINEDGTFTINSTTDPVGYFKMQAADQGWGVDTTHLNNFGASMVAYMFAQSLKATDNGLAAYVNDAEKPVFNHADCFNPDWVPFDEGEFIPSTVWKTTAPWYGSVFGDDGNKTVTEDSHPYHNITESPDGSVNLSVTNNNGKISSSTDGPVMYFQEIGANENFTLTATAHINSYNATNNQSAFGLMLRDNMFSDYYYKTNAPYFAVGNTAQNSGKEMVRAWRRFNATNGTSNLVKSVIATDAATADVFVGQDVDLMISRKDGVVTVQYGTEAPFTFLCDETKVEKDADGNIISETPYGPTELNQYNKDSDFVGIFVAREADVTFTNINYNNQ